MKGKVFALNLTLAAVSVLLAFLMLEGALRIAYPSPAKTAKPTAWAIIPERSWIEHDDNLGWWQESDKEAFLEKNGERVPVSTNRDGFRGSAIYEIDKQPGTVRVVAAGDSFTFGFGVKDDESFPAQLQALSPKLEVLNLGVPGYGVDQIHLSLIEKGLPYNPDLVIVSVYPEDFWRALRAYNDAGYGKPYYVLGDRGLELRQVPVPREKNFKVDQFPGYRGSGVWSWLQRHSYAVRFTLQAAGVILKKLGLEDPDTQPEWILGRAILNETQKALAEKKIPWVLMIVPPERWITGTDEPVRESMLRFGDRRGVPVLDLTPELREWSKEAGVGKLYIPGDAHWTPEGNRRVAQALYEFIRRNFPDLEI